MIFLLSKFFDVCLGSSLSFFSNCFWMDLLKKSVTTRTPETLEERTNIICMNDMIVKSQLSSFTVLSNLPILRLRTQICYLKSFHTFVQLIKDLFHSFIHSYFNILNFFSHF